jgi:DNA ligase 1
MMHNMTVTRRAIGYRFVTGWGALWAAMYCGGSNAQAMGAKVLLAQNAPPGLDPAPYWVSEKLDGVRALWDGTVLRFRSGRTINAPDWFLARLPKAALDGELWIARGRFDAASATVRRTQPVADEWKQLTYMVFEAPDVPGDFTQRAAHLQFLAKSAGWPQLQAVEQFRVANAAALRAKLKAVSAAGGEGLMLHLASAPVTAGRSPVLYKLKLVQDAEAQVVGHIPGKGKYQGVLGALDVKTPQGVRFKLGTGLTDAQRHNPPALGSTVTYSYRELTPGGKPRFASFVRVHPEE